MTVAATREVTTPPSKSAALSTLSMAPRKEPRSTASTTSPTTRQSVAGWKTTTTGSQSAVTTTSSLPKRKAWTRILSEDVAEKNRTTPVSRFAAPTGTVLP